MTVAEKKPARIRVHSTSLSRSGTDVARHGSVLRWAPSVTARTTRCVRAPSPPSNASESIAGPTRRTQTPGSKCSSSSKAGTTPIDATQPSARNLPSTSRTSTTNHNPKQKPSAEAGEPHIFWLLDKVPDNINRVVTRAIQRTNRRKVCKLL